MTMPTLYFAGFDGEVDTAEGTEQGEAFVVAEGRRAGTYPKLRERYVGKQGFFLHKEHAEMAAKGLLEAKIARLERDLELANKKHDELGG
jgi:hypothetical protein